MSEPTATIEKRWSDILTHTLGAGDDVPRKRHGYRNRFCANIGSPDYLTLVEMEFAGLVKAGVKINEGSDQYFFANESGCKAIGLSKAATKRAMED